MAIIIEAPTQTKIFFQIIRSTSQSHGECQSYLCYYLLMIPPKSRSAKKSTMIGVVLVDKQ